MAMAGFGTAGPTLVEAYVVRAQYKEKVKKQQKLEAVDKSTAGMVADYGKKIPGGCFFWVSKKNRSAKVSSATELDCDGKLQVDEKGDCKSQWQLLESILQRHMCKEKSTRRR
ncbi:hypothetical protein OWV82_024528 [Melia azedarach]|uniref:Uncharacterized protein n=1 Tax=Melia azedarach TaxID=155640 RepID=A0ACC1WQU8_MELAZ|nr:hypothetical protein OWV82_024528 [Melia azedarach]